MKRMLILLMMLCLLPVGAPAEFEDKFLPEGQEKVITEDVYRTRNIAVEISRFRMDNSDVYVADVYVRDHRSLRRGFAGGAWYEAAKRIDDIAEAEGAIVALTGDSSQHFAAGWAIGNGVVYRDTKNNKRDLYLMLRNGEMKGIQSEDMDHEALRAMSGDIWHTFLFGPILLDENGKALTDFSESSVRRANPRAAIGYYEPGHYCLVQVDGRSTESALEAGKKNRGMTLAQLAVLMESLGCTSAYNLDGGQSAAMWFQGKVISTPYGGGRGIGDVVLVAESEWLVED